MSKILTGKQAELDGYWNEFMNLCREKGFVIYEYQGVALISKHEIQLKTRTQNDYIAGQILNGNCLKKLGYDKCGIRNCTHCHLGDDAYK